ncbi:hypothetical protein HF324_18430 [Chitinophaga oryzae]|uniref:Uncharacterized protein n=1 Tax=Chitinophaga oryzae TaxID=2725414 RepID=A0ABX6LI66_9BACT|nr:hypothetical protein [Chitinophaga oryzae]QJB39726.1 hypothetical protein HF324_18430 [Chitinophaga oryzae]
MSWKDYGRAAEGYWIRHSRFMQGIRRLSFYVVRMACDPKHANKVKEEKLFRVITDPPVQKAQPVRIPKEQFQAIADFYFNSFNKN